MGSRAIALQISPCADTRPAWSPDGRRLAFQRRQDGNTDVWVMTLPTGSVRRLTSNVAFDGEPAWWPGSRIAFASGRTGSRDVWSILPDGTGLHRVLARSGRDSDPAWSPP